MTMTFHLNPELAERLRAEASRRGIQAEALVLTALDRSLPPQASRVTATSPTPGDQPATPPSDSREWHRLMDEFEAEFEEMTRDCPEIPLEALRRENMYADEER